MRRRALLLHPWIADYAAYDFWIQPLGLLWVASFLRQRGWEPILIDALDGARRRPRWDGTARLRSVSIPDPPAVRASGAHLPRPYRRYGISPAQLRRRLAAVGEPAALLVSSQMTYWYPGLRQSVSLARELWPGIPALLGGGYAALSTEHARTTPGIDAVLPSRDLGVSLTLLSRHLAVAPPTAAEVADLAAAWDLAPPAPHAALVTSWGCPFRCSYCATPTTHGAWRPRPAPAILRELRCIARDPAHRHIALYDDALLHHARDHFLEWTGTALSAGYGRERFVWHLPNAVHARWLDRRVAARLGRLGVETLWLGVERLDEAFHRATGGKFAAPDLDRALCALEAESVRPRVLGAYLLAGLPKTPDGPLPRSIEGIRRRGLRVAIASFSPVPGTRAFAEAQARESRLALDPIWQNNSLRELRAPQHFAALRALARDGG
ncbi:MAG: radical SAM protein [Candidatus Eisenbacteria bacterium]|nr:radical SAM protein [Candidatus Eisenbacteria bacterium]